jgi:hypothetical protein
MVQSKINAPKVENGETSTEINFECKKYGGIFDCDVGKVSVSEETGRPQFEKGIHCPQCGERSVDDVLLTEIGQSQLTAATLDFDFDDISFDENEWVCLSGHEGECQGCGGYQHINDFSLCDTCAGKLERDLIRQRDWDYSASALGVLPADREKLRNEVIAQYCRDLDAAPAKPRLPGIGKLL